MRKIFTSLCFVFLLVKTVFIIVGAVWDQNVYVNTYETYTGADEIR